MRSFHVQSVSTRTLRPILVKQIDRASYLMTDEASTYVRPGREFQGHGTVNHSIKEAKFRLLARIPLRGK